MSHHESTEIDQARRMLREISSMAEQASLTGAIQSGAPRLAEFYNRVLSQLQQQGIVQDGFFEPLNPHEADFGRISVDAHMLEAALGGPTPPKPGKERMASDGGADILCGLAPFIESHDLGLLVKEKLEAGTHIADHVLMSLAPFLESDMLGSLVRARIAKSPAAPSAPPSAPPAPENPRVAEAPEPTPAEPSNTWEPSISSVELASLGSKTERIQELAGQLARPDLSESERSELLQQIGALTWPQIR